MRCTLYTFHTLTVTECSVLYGVKKSRTPRPDYQNICVVVYIYILYSVVMMISQILHCPDIFHMVLTIFLSQGCLEKLEDNLRPVGIAVGVIGIIFAVIEVSRVAYSKGGRCNTTRGV